MPTSATRKKFLGNSSLLTVIDLEVEAVMDDDSMDQEGQESLLRRLGSLARHVNRRQKLTPGNKKTLVKDVFGDVGSTLVGGEEKLLDDAVKEAVALGVSRPTIVRAVNHGGDGSPRGIDGPSSNSPERFSR